MRIAGLIAVAWVSLAAVGPASASELQIRASARPHTVGVGDVFSYVVEVRAPTGFPEPALGDVRAGTGAFRVLEPPRYERRETPAGAVIRVSQRLACFDHGCVPRAGSRRVVLPAARVSVGAEVASAAPVGIVVRPRVAAASVAGGPSAYRRQTAIPRPEGRFDSTAAIWLLGVAGLAVAAVALVLVGSAGRPIRRRVREDALGRAIRLLRESARHPAPDRRLAADLLAQVVGRPTTLAEAATELAWSPPDPSAEETELLAARASRGRL